MEIFILTSMVHDRMDYDELIRNGEPFLSMEAATAAINGDLADESYEYNENCFEDDEVIEAPTVEWHQGIVQSDGYAEWSYYSETFEREWLLRRFAR